MNKQNNRSLLNNRFSTRLNKSGMNQVIELGNFIFYIMNRSSILANYFRKTNLYILVHINNYLVIGILVMPLF